MMVSPIIYLTCIIGKLDNQAEFLLLVHHSVINTLLVEMTQAGLLC